MRKGALGWVRREQRLGSWVGPTPKIPEKINEGTGGQEVEMTGSERGGRKGKGRGRREGSEGGPLGPAASGPAGSGHAVCGHVTCGHKRLRRLSPALQSTRSLNSGTVFASLLLVKPAPSWASQPLPASPREYAERAPGLQKGHLLSLLGPQDPSLPRFCHSGTRGKRLHRGDLGLYGLCGKRVQRLRSRTPKPGQMTFMTVYSKLGFAVDI